MREDDQDDEPGCGREQRISSIGGIEGIEEQRQTLLAMVAEHLSPLAVRYGYSDVPLEATIKWRPLVLILGNYSSGKSTFINELLGLPVQQTGQAPTDDAFTVITAGEEPGVAGEREGSVLLGDPRYPFSGLKRHGQRFAAHFRLKQVDSPLLRNLAVIDTPGMLDSSAEHGRGYDYQAVIGDLAALADLVLVFFDPHKAGTVREAHASLRDTLPTRTGEDRVVFVLNRIDECDHLADLLRCYGTLCWNLSQMLGRKDMPPIRLSYATPAPGARVASYLSELGNQREEVKELVRAAPRFRLDHLAAFAEEHGEKLAHFLEALLAYKRRQRTALWRFWLTALTLATAVGLGLGTWVYMRGLVDDPDGYLWVGGAGFLLALGLLALILRPLWRGRDHRVSLRELETLTPLATQQRRDSWQAVRTLVRDHLHTTHGRFASADVKSELKKVQRVLKEEVREARAMLHGSLV